ncbi:hypothetical protein C8F04DRAFT_1119215 [Mycena alexandri]|uniref:Ricin B lectin domain-containing protein n=1 Tax=Mycena alexandri TaxID=1745969 RepID=A0AAD6SLH6_9AGAR|nr:hypothetical protein C8F04DRAFT_1119215 [Mycena alexandri]
MFSRNLFSVLSVSVSLSLCTNAQFIGEPGNCLAATNNADGAAVVIEECGNNATALNSWVVPQGADQIGTIQIFGDKIVFEDQMWLPSGGEATIKWPGTSKCVDLTNSDLADGNQIQIWDCDETLSNPNQIWNVLAVTEPKSFTVSLKKDTSLCITASSNATNAAVVVDTCKPGSVLQTWSDPKNNGQIALADNQCITLDGSIANDGTKLILSPCVESSVDIFQLWSHQTGVLNSGAAAKSCIDLTNGVETPANQLQLWTCWLFTTEVDNTNQDWIVNNTF